MSWPAWRRAWRRSSFSPESPRPRWPSAFPTARLGSSSRLRSWWRRSSVPGMERDLRVGIVGYGLAGAVFHAPLVAATPGLTVAAIVTGNPERRERAEREHPGARVVEHPEDMVGDIDVVVVAT